jgi:tetratricopeptide (TPR) repeat protein
MTSKICVVLHTLRAAMPWNLVFSRRRRATQKKNENLKENAMDQDESTKVVKEHSEFEEGKKENAMNQDEGAKVVKGHSEFEEGQRFYWLDDYTKAEQLLQEAVSIQEKEFGTYNRRLLPTKYWLGRTLYAQGKFDAAEAVFRQVVDGRKSPLMPIKDHLDALGAEIWLGYSFYAQSKSGEEEKHVRRQSKSVRPPTVSVQSLAGYSLGEEAVRRIVADDGNSHDLGHGKFFRQLLIDDDESVRSLSFCEEPGIVPHIEFGAKHGCSNCQDVLQSLQYFRDIHFKQGTLLNLSLRAPLFHRDSILVAASYAEFSESSSDVVRKNLTYFIMPSLSKYIAVNALRYRTNSTLKVLSSTLASRHQLTSIGSLLRPANKWLQDCTKKHPHCAVPDPTFIPRRLVSVGHRQSDPFLTEDQPVHCKYAALSYCWGSTEDTLMTKRHNLLQHFETIDTMALPKVIFLCHHFPLHSIRLTLTETFSLDY